MEKDRLGLYGTGWCLKSSNLMNYLQSIGVDFDFYNVETDADSNARVRSLYNGELKFPTIVFNDDFLKNPKISALKSFLEARELIP
ncbi:MAG: hypothetical protein KI790_17200 [Cyclobacteriaceae bacterium]|nr:hypothetical protein [Cyclobacteriaceae bacterium HetDA_MAG_MS6]